MRISNAIVRLVKASSIDILPDGDVSVSPGVGVSTPETGYTYPQIHRILSMDPEMSFATRELKLVLDELGITGTCITSGGTITGVTAFGQRHDQCTAGARSAGSDHLSSTVSEGHVFLSGIQAAGNSPAVANLMVYGMSSDGTTDPQAQVYNIAAIPAQPVGTEYIAGNCKIGNIYINRPTNVEVIMNTEAERVRYAGSLWPKLIDIMRVAMVVRIQTDNIDLVGPGGSQIPHTGVNITHANSFIQFLKKKQGGGGTEPAASTVHIKGTIAGMAYASRQYNASGNGAAGATIDIPLLHDGTNVPIVWNTAIAYATS